MAVTFISIELLHEARAVDGKRFLLPLALITMLFFLWALGVNLNDILIPHLKKAFRLTDLQSSLIQVAFFGGYFFAAWPAGRLMDRIGYKKGGGVASFIIRFVDFTSPGTSDKIAANYLKLHLIGFILGRFAGSFLMKYVRAPHLLAIFACGALASVLIALAASGDVAIAGIVAAGFFHSIMFPTIFALSIKSLGPLTKSGASLLVMAIIGGALFPPLMGFISDLTNIQYAFVVPLTCYIYIFYFATRGYRVRDEAGLTQCHATA